MTSDVLVTAPKSRSDFRIFSGALSPFDSGDGQRRLRTIASSSVEDLGGDVVSLKALEKMAASAKGMTIFRNHQYKIPDDLLGTCEAAHVKQAGTDENGKPIYDLVMDIVVLDSPKPVETYEAVKAGVQLGTSIGAMIPKGTVKKNPSGDGHLFDDLRLLEASIVGIPQNPRSWVQYATKAYEVKGAVIEDDEDDDNEGFHADAEPDLTEAKVWVNHDQKGNHEVIVDTDGPAPEPDAAPAPKSKAKAKAKDVEPEIEMAATCSDCGGTAAKPKGACKNPMHKPAAKSEEPDVLKDVEEADPTEGDASTTAQADPTIQSSINLLVHEMNAEGEEEDPAQEASDEEGAPESAGDALDAVLDETADGDDAALGDAVTRGVDALALVLRDATRELVSTRKALTEATEAKAAAEAERDEARENLAVAKEIVERIANAPMGRRAVFHSAVSDFRERFGGIYSAEVLKMLETKDNG